MSYRWRKVLVLTVFLSTPMLPLAVQAQTAHAKTSSAPADKTTTAPEARTDDAIQDRIEHRLATDDAVKKYEISVKVNNGDRKSTRLNSSHLGISYAVFCLKKKKKRK